MHIAAVSPVPVTNAQSVEAVEAGTQAVPLQAQLAKAPEACDVEHAAYVVPYVEYVAFFS